MSGRSRLRHQEDVESEMKRTDRITITTLRWRRMRRSRGQATTDGSECGGSARINTLADAVRLTGTRRSSTGGSPAIRSRQQSQSEDISASIMPVWLTSSSLALPAIRQTDHQTRPGKSKNGEEI
ncbi:MAG: hypothetical protein D6723_03635 [Acidobacteria bacterium]|nr:MAG: hypothetical protein D6723_03635 [Acidobacteriota bacterium]